MTLRRVMAAAGVLLLTASAVTAGVLTGRPADAAVPSVEGSLIALDPDPVSQYIQFESVSNDYFTFPSLRDAQYRTSWQVRSTVDGTVAYQKLSTPDDSRAPEIAGRSLVTRTGTADGTRIAFTPLGTAPAAGAITVPTGDDILAVTEKGLLVAHTRGPADQVLQVLSSDGVTREVAGIPYVDGPKVVDSDGTTLLLQNYRQLFTIDLTDATAALIVQTDLPLEWAAMTPNRIMWSAVASNRQVEWKHRDGSPGGTVTVPFTEDFTTFGDDLVVRRIPADDDLNRRLLVPVSLADGQAGAPVLDAVAATYPLEDGRMLVARQDAVSVLATNLARTTLAPVQPTYRVPNEVVISNGQVLTGFEDATVRQTNLTATSWTPRTDLPVVKNGNGLEFGGDTLLRQSEMLVRWPGGQRQLDKNIAAKLGRGGVLLSAYSFASHTYAIQNARTGAVLATLPDAREIAMDGTWAWQAPDPATGILAGTDVTTGQKKSVPSSVRCVAGSFHVAGRWALVNCDVHQQYVVDLFGIVPDYRLPDDAPAANLLPAVGDGFVVRFRYTPNGQGQDTPELLVTDLNSPTHPERVVGPIRGLIWPPGAIFALDDKAPRIAYADPLSRIRVATVNWLAAPPPTQLDTAAPKYVSSSAGARTSTSPTVRYSYRFTDNTAVASYDVVYRSAASGKALGKWTYPASWQKTRSTAVSVTPAPGTDACFMVRARDARGNLSAWSPVTCALTPQDDRALAATRSFARLTYRTGYRGTLTQLRASGATLYKDGEYGNRVAVTVLTAPKQGVVDVAFAGRRVGRISLASSSVALKTFYLPVGAFRTGRVTVTSLSGLPASVDAVGLLRA